MNVMDRKKCCVCNRYLTNENQYINKKRWYICKKCATDYFRRFAVTERKIQRHKVMKELKINGCAICGYNECNEALDFHHVNPWNKKFSINMTNLYRSNSDIGNEVLKCILLCKNCHTKIHAKERNVPLRRKGYIKELQNGGD